jgi:hypothetical protein
MREGDYMGKIDLKDAYFSVGVREKDRKYLRFKWQGKTYHGLFGPMTK